MTRCRTRELCRRTGSERLTLAILAKNIGKIYNIAPYVDEGHFLCPSIELMLRFFTSPKYLASYLEVLIGTAVAGSYNVM